MTTLIHRRVEECRAGTNPRTIARVSSGWVVLGEAQFLRGYCLLLPDPVVPHLNALHPSERSTLLFEASLVGDALLEATKAVRINYEILGNLDPALHVHVFPRYADEPEALRTKPVWFYDWSSAPQFDAARDKPLMERILKHLEKAGVVA